MNREQLATRQAKALKAGQALTMLGILLGCLSAMESVTLLRWFAIPIILVGVYELGLSMRLKKQLDAKPGD